MNKKTIVLAGGLGLALAGFGEPAIKDGSLVGWWRFDNPSDYKEDSSGYGSSINGDISNGTPASSGGYSGGKINLGDGKKFTATLADSAPVIPGTTMPYYTLAARFKSGGRMAAWRGRFPSASCTARSLRFLPMCSRFG